MSGEGRPDATRRRPVKWKADEDRGDFGAWLTAQVGERTYDWLADEMAARGHAHRADYYRAMAGGSKSGGRIIRAALREFFGATESVSPPSGQPDLAGALLELAREVRAAREAREAWERGLIEVLRAYRAGEVSEALLDALVPQPREGARP